MLKPSGGFKKLFSPERMAKMSKAQPRMQSKPSMPNKMANRERKGGFLGRAMERKAY